MTAADPTDTFRLGDLSVRRVGYGAMQLAGPGVFGPPRDPAGAVALLREAVALGVNHIDTSDFYGPHVVNELIRDALHPYPGDLVVVTKVGVFRGEDGSWNPASTPADLTRAVHDNLRNLKVDVLDVVNFRRATASLSPTEGSIEEPFTALAELQRKGLIRHLGLSGVTSTQLAEARRIADVVCVQNQYNLVGRHDDPLLEETTRASIAYVPFFPLGGFSPLQSATLSEVAAASGVGIMQVALAWLLHRAPNILLIPGTSSIGHLRENLGAGALQLPASVLDRLDHLSPS